MVAGGVVVGTVVLGEVILGGVVNAGVMVAPAIQVSNDGDAKHPDNQNEPMNEMLLLLLVLLL